MKISEILTPERTGYQVDASSKKRVLELLSNKLAEAQEGISSSEVFDSLLARERIGSTGLGKGVALPHGRVKDIDQTICAFFQLREGIDFDSIDQQPVDLVCALLVPQSSTDEHLRLLASLADIFRDEEFCSRLRKASSREALYRELVRRQPPPDNHGDGATLRDAS